MGGYEQEAPTQRRGESVREGVVKMELEGEEGGREVRARDVGLGISSVRRVQISTVWLRAESRGSTQIRADHVGTEAP